MRLCSLSSYKRSSDNLATNYVTASKTTTYTICSRTIVVSTGSKFCHSARTTREKEHLGGHRRARG